MTETKRYEIRISSDESENEVPEPKIGQYENSAQNSTMIGNFKSFLRTNVRRAEESSPWAYGVIETSKYAMSLASRIANDYIDSWWMLEEDYVGQTNVSNAKAVIGIVSNVGKSTINGALTGAKIGGAPGAIIGAAIGLTTSGFDTALKARATVVNEYRSLEETAYSQYFSGVRYGLINGGRGTEN